MFMFRRTGLGLAFGALVLLAGCSQAPVVPVRPTNRIVLVDMVSQTG